MNELILNKDEITRPGVTPSQLQAIADAEAARILEKIKEQSDKIDSAKDAAVRAKNYERPNLIRRNLPSFLGGKSDGGEKVDKVASAVVRTNEAVAGLGDLVQESIKFTCTSVRFAQVMHKTMAYMMVNGFKDTNGNLQKLSGSSQEFAEEILSAAEDFVVKQAAVEEKQAELDLLHRQQQEINESNIEQLSELRTLFDGQRKTFDEQEQKILTLLDHMKMKEGLDKEQSVLIEKLRSRQTHLLISSAISIGVAASALAVVYYR